MPVGGPPTVADAIAGVLAAAGVRRVWGAALPGLAAIDLGALSPLMADAEGAVGPAPGVAVIPHGGGVRLRVSSRPGAVAHAVAITDPADAAAAVAAAILPRPDGCPHVGEVDLDVDLAAPVSAVVGPSRPEPSGLDPAVADRLRAAEGDVIVVVGPGVVRQGPGEVAATARAKGVGVLNSWGAKGLFPWQDPHHLGTAGLQAADFELARLDEAGAVVACGLDPAESPRYRLGRPDGLVVDPAALTAAIDVVTARPAPPPRPMFDAFAAALAPHYAGDIADSPVSVVMAAKADLAPGGLLVADPGPAGLWVARTFPTDEPGQVCVPAVGDEGVAAAAALGAVLAGRLAIAVTHEPMGPITAAVVEAARSMGVELDVRVWGPSTGVDWSHTAALEDVAGPVVAWT